MRKVAASAAAAIAVTAGAAFAAEPLVPPPAGAPLVLEAMGDGVQIYTCEAKDQGFAWALKAPEAKLTNREGRQVATHFAGPTWKASDGSAVVGEVVARADAPATGSIPWLLLRAKSHDGAGTFATVAFVRRSLTKDGAAPASGCDAAHRGVEQRVAYSALYQFYGAAR
jgi:uncharacterized protein DUF3455